jgi:hypothetical protein
LERPTRSVDCRSATQENSGDDDDELPNYTIVEDSERSGYIYAFDMAIPDSTDPADEEIMETNPEEESVETGEQESMETDLKEETVGTDDEDDSDTDFVPASNDCGLCQLPVRTRPSCMACPPARLTGYVQ